MNVIAQPPLCLTNIFLKKQATNQSPPKPPPTKKPLSRTCFSSYDHIQTEMKMWEKKENMDIMRGAPCFEKILG